MEVEMFEIVNKRRREMIEEAKQNKVTAFFLPPHHGEGPVYLLEGEEVSKETFILESGMEHLLPDVSTVKCSQCQCSDSPSRWHQPCGLPLPSGETCTGIFF
ncbi:hypothetical protein GO285_01417 [Ralstonia solanacearum]|nr:hypothetical protein [Ralstonia solanacearum]NKG09650.1 hypothetical protein [Ralstonia solanacearum]